MAHLDPGEAQITVVLEDQITVLVLEPDLEPLVIELVEQGPDGAAGAPGAPGAPGSTGPPGPTGPRGELGSGVSDDYVFDGGNF